MKKHKHLMRKLLSFAFASALLCIQAIPVSAAATVTNNGRIGAVDIELKQSFPPEQTMVVPGQTVSIESSVENKGQPAWLRVKLEYPSSEEGLKTLDDSLITFADDAAESPWKKIGEYYYCTTAAATGDNVPFTKSLTFPNDWDNSMKNKTIGISFTAEAVQEKNFVPDFSSDDPWHGVVIEAFDSDGYELKTEGTEQFSVTYKGGAEGMVTLGDDFFANWGDLMPGDTVSGTAEIANAMKIPVEMYFEMENSGDPELLEKITMKITNGGSTVYEGPLSGSVHPAVLLKKYKSGEKTKLAYSLTVPAELNNTSALKEFQVKWTFTAKEIPPKEPKKSDPVNSVKKAVSEKAVQAKEAIKTGEYNMIIGICGIAIVAVSTGLLYWRKRKELK